MMALTMASWMVVPTLAQVHHHEGDFVVGRTSGGQVQVEGPFYERVKLAPVSGPLLWGWSATSPGFDALDEDEPAEDFYRLASGATIYLRVVRIDPGLTIWQSGLTAGADEPGEEIYLGGSLLHTHPVWHVDSTVLGIGPDWQGTLAATVELVDYGSTSYADSPAITLYFTNRPDPTVPGDVEGDGLVDVVDLLYLVDSFGTLSGDASFDPWCDFNEDGAVDVVDLLTLVENFGQQ
jgi:hypothetical protein